MPMRCLLGCIIHPLVGLPYQPMLGEWGAAGCVELPFFCRPAPSPASRRLLPRSVSLSMCLCDCQLEGGAAEQVGAEVSMGEIRIEG